MGNITTDIENIRSAVYGRDVRESIADAIEQVYEDATQVDPANTNLEVIQARSTYPNLNAREDAQDTATASVQSALGTETSNRTSQDALLQAQIDQLIAPTGEAPSAAEVQNARIGADGTTYDTLGNAIRGQVSDLKTQIKDISQYACLDLLPIFSNPRDNLSKNGIDFIWNADKTELTVSGTASALTNYNLYNNTSALPYGVKAGETYQLDLTLEKLGTNNVGFQIFFYSNGSSLGSTTYTKGALVKVPSNADGMIIRLLVAKDYVVNSKYSNIRFIAGVTSKRILAVEHHEILPLDADLNDYYENNEARFISYPSTISHLPDGFQAGVLFVYKLYGFTMQLAYAYSGAKAFKRFRNNTAGTWNDWVEISGTSVNQIFNEYSSTNTISVSPSITTDTNNYLASTGDTTDVTASIEAMLSQTGICRLGTGAFWVSGIDMPDDSTIIGSGAETKIYLLGTDNTEGYAIKMGSRCTIQNVSVLGNTNNYTANTDNYPSDAAIVARHGIIWQGNYSGGGTDIPRRGIISGCYIANFTGGGIACYDTGTNVISGVNVTDCIVWHCYAGIYIPYQSEFNRFSNVMATHCHYGAINNGGNNVFVNCNFSKNICGFLIDNTSNQAPNNAHGSVSNCIFDHSDSNSGIGIKLIGITPGEVFTGCQLFYSQICIKDCNGVNFVGLNAGWGVGQSGEVITIDGGSLVMFNDCVFRVTPSITVTNNTNVKFINCFTYDGTAVTP